MSHEEALADADRLRRDLDELVVGDELDRVLERELRSAARARTASSVPDARTLVSCLPLIGLTTRSLSRLWMPMTMPSYSLSPGDHEHPAALLQLPQRVGDRVAILRRRSSTPLRRSGMSPFTGA